MHSDLVIQGNNMAANTILSTLFWCSYSLPSCYLSSFSPFHLLSPSLFLTATCCWSATPTHLFSNFCQKSCLLREWILPKFPRYLLIIKPMKRVRQDWLYVLPLSNPLKHLLCDDDIVLTSKWKITYILARTCVWDTGKKGKFHWIFRSCLYPVQHENPTNCQEWLASVFV